MPVCNGLLYSLVAICIVSHWVEAYPTRRNDSLTVVKLLLQRLITRFGLPIFLESDRGAPFKNKVMKMLCVALQVDQILL